MCDSGVFFQYLLGATLKDDKIFLTDSSKPRVTINFQDHLGRTALHYALEP